MAEPRDIVVIGGSAGSIEALTQLVGALPGELDAALFVVIHSFPVGDSMLPSILNRETRLRTVVAGDGDPIECDRIYVPPRDTHLLVHRGHIKLSSGPKESGNRPAIDPLFRSAARSYGERVTGVILSGTLDDGSKGLRVVRRHGGNAIVQEPTEALFPQMPNNAIEAAQPQHVAPVAEIARLIASHTGRGKHEGEVREAMGHSGSPPGGQYPVGSGDAPGTPTGIACPDCHGVLWASSGDDDGPEFGCRIGHGYSAEALLEAHGESVESALWAGIRALEEQASLAKHMAGKAERRGDRLTAQRLVVRGSTADEHAGLIRAMLLKSTPKPA